MLICAIASSGEEIFLSPEEQQILKQRLALIILQQHKRGCRDFYVNCNYGVPLWTAGIPYTNEQKHLANSVDLPEFLQMRGETLERAGREYDTTDTSRLLKTRSF